MLHKLFLGAAALVLGLAMTGTASAAGFHGHHGHHGHHHGHRPYYARAGVRFDGGYYFRGRHHSHFGPRVWNAGFGRYHYWEPQLKCYYFWSRPHGCYFPVGARMPF